MYIVRTMSDKDQWPESITGRKRAHGLESWNGRPSGVCLHSHWRPFCIMIDGSGVLYIGSLGIFHVGRRGLRDPRVYLSAKR